MLHDFFDPHIQNKRAHDLAEGDSRWQVHELQARVLVESKVASVLKGSYCILGSLSLVAALPLFFGRRWQTLKDTQRFTVCAWNMPPLQGGFAKKINKSYFFRRQENKEEDMNIVHPPAYSWGSIGRSMTLWNAAIQSFWSSSVSQANRNFLSGVTMVMPYGQWLPWTFWGRPTSTV